VPSSISSATIISQGPQHYLCSTTQTGIQETVLQAGDVAPSFTLPDQEGRLVHSQELLAQGPLVLVFYRGMW
jgi:hypothetical protein